MEVRLINSATGWAADVAAAVLETIDVLAAAS